MEPRDNDTQTLLNDTTSTRPTSQQQASGELIVSHEAELDTSVTANQTLSQQSAPQYTPDLQQTPVSASVPGQEVPAAPVQPQVFGDPQNQASLAPGQLPPQPGFSGQPAAFGQAEFQQPPQAPVVGGPGPASPVADPAAPSFTAQPNGGPQQVPAAQDAAQPTPATQPDTAPHHFAEPKNKAMVLGLILIAALIIIGLGVYVLVNL